MSVNPEEPTVSFEGSPTPIEGVVGLPQSIGRYRVRRILGQGGFGVVYQAHDEKLQRIVAVKVPHPGVLQAGHTVGDSLTEARALASLDHPHIVPVYDLGTCADFPIFIVTKFIDGIPLSTAITRRHFPPVEVARLIADIAGALHYAHTRGLVHRDVKPGNILIDQQGQPFLTDFGLALREDQFGQFEGAMFGTPFYMSPEQARGEGHLVDGRSDIFSLGVILYEMLTGTRPFQGATAQDVMRAVISFEPRPMRQKNDQIPRELDRICQQAMTKLTAERYSTARDLEEDLRHAIAQMHLPSVTVEPFPDSGVSAASPTRQIEPASEWNSGRTQVIVPKGLRAYDEQDREFFLSLLPGPFDREGLPQSLRFWKARLEDQHSQQPLRVGVVYGPSGCGKSSLIRAGLIPKLGSDVRPIVITATAHATEQHLLERLKEHVPQPTTGLIETAQRARRSNGTEPRLLIIIDQFEQWLHANQPNGSSPLIQALRQCDGVRLTCLLIVRDDFWMSVHRFFRELDLRLAEHENCLAVDLFDLRHARRVLHALGNAYGALPDRVDDLTSGQQQFLDQAVQELAEKEHVICVRLALFAQMIRNRPWSTVTLAHVGGAQGVGVRFLEDTLGASTAPLPYRIHQSAIREILRALLPPPGTDIKACTRSSAELAQAANYDVTTPEFQQVIRILEEETRLLTPVDTLDSAAEESAAPERRAYQLTHDYLVPSIRAWLTSKQRETWQGRARLRLEERAALWNAQQERRQLPSLWETAQILLGTQARDRTPTESLMMDRAKYLHGSRVALAILLACVGLTTALIVQRQVAYAREKAESNALVEQLLVAEPQRLLPVLRAVKPRLPQVADRLHKLTEDPQRDQPTRWRAAMALVDKAQPQVDALAQLLVRGDSQTIAVTGDWLAEQHVPAEIVEASLAKHLPIPVAPISQPTLVIPRLHLCRQGLLLRAGGVAKPGDAQASPQGTLQLTAQQQSARQAIRELLTEPIAEAEEWSELLRPAKELYIPMMTQLFRDPSLTETERTTLAHALIRMGDGKLCCELLVEADSVPFARLLNAITHEPALAVPWLENYLTNSTAKASHPEPLEAVQRKRRAAIALLRLGHQKHVWPLLRATADPSLRMELVLSMAAYEIPRQLIENGLQTETDPSTRQALWLALADLQTRFSPAEIRPFENLLYQHLSRTDITPIESSGVLFARDAFYKAHRSDRSEWSPARRDEAAGAVNAEPQRFLDLPGPIAATIGSPPDEIRREAGEDQYSRELPHGFAIAINEVTLGQFQKFQPNYAYDPFVSPSPDCPASSVSWFMAARYCRWLSEQEQIPEAEMCYPPVDQIQPGMKLPADVLTRTGYRLPTEVEWEYACRAGTTTRFYFGNDESRASAFCWWGQNAEDRTWPVRTRRPNQWGLFDMQGNVNEWCHEAYQEHPAAVPMDPHAQKTSDSRVGTGEFRIFRGANFRQWARKLRSAQREKNSPSANFSIMGFRVARTLRSPLPVKAN